MEAKKIVFHGVEYPSQRACAQAWNLTTYDIKHYRSKTGCSFIEAMEHFVSGKVNSADTSYSITAFGIQHQSAADCAAVNGVETHQFRAALHKGLTPEEAISWCKSEKPQGIKVEFRGTTYNSQKEAAEAFGLEPIVVRNWMYAHNCTFADALERCLDPQPRIHAKNKGNSVSVTFRGKKYPSMAACAETFGLSAQGVQYHAKRYKISFQTAMEKCIKAKKKRVSA